MKTAHPEEKKKVSNILLLNQMAGPLFRELAEDLADKCPVPCTLSTGHPDAFLNTMDNEGALRLRRSPGHNRKSLFSRAASWLHYLLDSLIFLVQKGRGAGLIVTTNPPIMGPIAWLFKKIWKVRYTIIVYDVYPDVLTAFQGWNSNGLICRLWRFFNRITWESADVVIAIGPVMAEVITRQFDPSKTGLGRVMVLPPWVDTDIISPIAKSENPFAKKWGQVGRITIIFSGNHGYSHDIDSILSAANILRERDDIRFLLIGGGAKWADALAYRKKHNLLNLEVLPFQPEEVLPFSLGTGDIAISTLDAKAEGLMFPSKTCYYMAAGSAVIGICQGKNDLRHALEESGCGICIPPEEPERLAATIAELVDDPIQLTLYQRHARQAAVSKFSRTVNGDRLWSILRDQGWFQDND